MRKWKKAKGSLVTPAQGIGRWNLALLSFLLLFTAGCVRYDESLDIHADRSGTATLILERPDDARASAAAEMFSEKYLSQELPPKIALKYNQASSNGRVTTTATYTFDDIRSLVVWAANKRSPLSNISLVEKPGELEFSRRISPITDSTADDVKQFGSEITLTFTLKGPGPLLESNAPKSDAQSATWTFTAPELFGPSGRTLTALFSRGHSTTTYVLAALAIFALNIMMAVWFRKRHNLRSRQTRP